MLTLQKKQGHGAIEARHIGLVGWLPHCVCPERLLELESRMFR